MYCSEICNGSLQDVSLLFFSKLSRYMTQVAERQLGAEAPSFSAIGQRLIREQGIRGLWKGVAPRLMNVALWVRDCISSCRGWLHHCLNCRPLRTNPNLSCLYSNCWQKLECFGWPHLQPGLRKLPPCVLVRQPIITVPRSKLDQGLIAVQGTTMVTTYEFLKRQCALPAVS